MAIQLGADLDASKNVSLRDNGDGSLSVVVGADEKIRFKPNGSVILKGQTQTRLINGSGIYQTPEGCVRLRIRMVGGGGGGGSYYNANNAGDTSFGVLFAGGGGGGVYSGDWRQGFGGSAWYIAPAVGFAIKGADGQPGERVGDIGHFAGGQGGFSPFGGAGGGSTNNVGKAAASNTGSGGGGGGCYNATRLGAGGGGAGGYVDVIIDKPSVAYSYAIGAGGPGGDSGGGLYRGGAGADGIIVIDEFYI
jgi:hypothetical protein